MWKTISRPGYFKGKRNYDLYNFKYGEGNWRIVWGIWLQVKQKQLDFMSSLEGLNQALDGLKKSLEDFKNKK